MPEGDTVYLAAKRMAAALSGQRLTRGELRHPRLAEHDLSGLTVLSVHSVGKHLLTRFDNGRSLHTHFRRSGISSMLPRMSAIAVYSGQAG